METVCPKCGGKTEAGVATAFGLLFGGVVPKDKPRLQFVMGGSPTSSNPLKAFRQGIEGEPDTRVFWIEGERCSNCGYLELFALRTAAG